MVCHVIVDRIVSEVSKASFLPTDVPTHPSVCMVSNSRVGEDMDTTIGLLIPRDRPI